MNCSQSPRTSQERTIWRKHIQTSPWGEVECQPLPARGQENSRQYFSPGTRALPQPRDTAEGLETHAHVHARTRTHTHVHKRTRAHARMCAHVCAHGRDRRGPQPASPRLHLEAQLSLPSSSHCPPPTGMTPHPDPGLRQAPRPPMTRGRSDPRIPGLENLHLRPHISGSGAEPWRKESSTVSLMASVSTK